MAPTPVLNTFDPARAADIGEATAELISRRQRFLGAGYRLFYEHPVYLERAEGVWLYGKNGEKYLDGYNNVPSVGHCHAHVLAAVARQASALNIHTRYLFDILADYAEKLIGKFPAELGKVMFTCSGSEATDLALRVARTFTKGEGIVVTRHAYHGTTAAASEVSPSRGATSPRVRLVDSPDLYRSTDGNVAQHFASDVANAIAALQADGIKFAGMISDTAYCSDGLCVDPAGFLRDVVEVVHKAGGVFIADEVQPGFARTGTHMWGFQRHGIIPDLVAMGKAMGNGLPIGGVVGKAELFDTFGKTNRYFNTFGGNPVCCAAGLAVLEVIEQEGLMENARAVGEHLNTGFKKLAGKYPAIGNVRNAGLIVGVEFVKDHVDKEPDGAAALAVVNALRDRSILISTMGPYGNVLKIRPPLPFSRENAEQLLSETDAILAAS
jgi:4-aminobutyrate aminotransferase-like enzyme